MVMAYRWNPCCIVPNYPCGPNYFGYASTPYGVQYGWISIYPECKNEIAVMTYDYTPSTFTYNGSTYYTYVVNHKSYTTIDLPGSHRLFFDWTNKVYTYASTSAGYYVYEYDILLGSTTASLLLGEASNIITLSGGYHIRPDTGLLFKFYRNSESILYWASIQHPFIKTFNGPWASTVLQPNCGIINVLDYEASFIINYHDCSNRSTIVNAADPTNYTVKTLTQGPNAVYYGNGSLYAYGTYNGGNVIYVMNSNFDVVASYVTANFGPYRQLMSFIGSNLSVVGGGGGFGGIIFYNISNGSMIVFQRLGTNVYDYKHGMWIDFVGYRAVTAIVMDNPIYVDTYTLPYKGNQVYVIASVSVAMTKPVENYLVKFYYTSIPYSIYRPGTDLPAMIYRFYNYIGSAYTNSSGIASVLFTLPTNKNAELYYFAEVEPGVLYNG